MERLAQLAFDAIYSTIGPEYRAIEHSQGIPNVVLRTALHVIGWSNDIARGIDASTATEYGDGFAELRNGGSVVTGSSPSDIRDSALQR